MKILNNQRGSILIVVIIVITAIFSLAILRSEKTVAQYDKITSIHNIQQGKIYSASIMKGIIDLLVNDNNNFDYTKEKWSLVPVISTSHGQLRVVVIPLNSKISVAGLLSTKGDIRKRTESALNSITPEIKADLITEKMKKLSPYSLGDLRFMGFYDISNNTLGDLTVEDTDGRININFASESIIKAYLPELEGVVDEIMKYREHNPFRDTSQLRKVAGVTDKIYLAVQPYITVSSQLFYVFTEAEVNETKSYTSAIARREAGKTRILKYFEEAEEFYVFE